MALLDNFNTVAVDPHPLTTLASLYSGLDTTILGSGESIEKITNEEEE